MEDGCVESIPGSRGGRSRIQRVESPGRDTIELGACDARRCEVQSPPRVNVDGAAPARPLASLPLTRTALDAQAAAPEK
jgi:hypothetical protein